LVSERTRRYMSPTVLSVCFRTVEIDIKRQRKILTNFFGGGYGLFGLILSVPLDWVQEIFETLYPPRMSFSLLSVLA